MHDRSKRKGYAIREAIPGYDGELRRLALEGRAIERDWDAAADQADPSEPSGEDDAYVPGPLAGAIISIVGWALLCVVGILYGIMIAGEFVWYWLTRDNGAGFLQLAVILAVIYLVVWGPAHLDHAYRMWAAR